MADSIYRGVRYEWKVYSRGLSLSGLEETRLKPWLLGQPIRNVNSTDYYPTSTSTTVSAKQIPRKISEDMLVDHLG